jgi:hypothetical protein
VGKSVCTLIVVVPPDPLSPNPSISSVMKTQENTEERPDNPEPADEGDIKMEYNCDKLCSPSTVVETKNYLSELRSISAL